MKIIIFDVGDAFCSIVVSPKGYGMMIDCGSNSGKDCPVDVVKSYRKWLGLKDFVTSDGRSYPLGLLHITHPDEDHVKNAKKIASDLKPYVVQRTRWEEFSDGAEIHDEYKKQIDNQYRGTGAEDIDWSFDVNKTFQIPMSTLKNEAELSKKLRNNSSIIRYIKHNGVSIMFTGDLETPAWEWLVENDKDFVATVRNGVDIFIAPHHGHISGFPRCLFDVMGNAQMVIHSKGSEVNIEGTDVSNRYSENADGVHYKGLNDQASYFGKVLSTRSNGHIFIETGANNFNVYTSKASSNHKKY